MAASSAAFERLLGEPERVERAGERAQWRVEQSAGLRRAPLQPARRLRQRPDDGVVALESAERVAQIDRDLFSPLHRQPPLGEALFLARFRREFRQLGVGVAQIIGVGPGLGEALLLVLKGPPRRLHRAMQRAQRLHLARQPAMRVDQLPMRGGIDHRALVVLAVDLDQFLAYGAQGLGADRRVVDISAGAPVRRLRAAQDQFAVRGDPEFARLEVGGMIGARLERRAHLAVRLSRAHQRGVAAPAQRQHESVEQDRLSSAGLAGERRQPARKIEIERVDQHDVADGKADEHGAPGLKRNREPCLSDFPARVETVFGGGGGG